MANETIRFAQDELDRYLKQMGVSGSIQLGLLAEFSGIDAPGLADPWIDDSIYIDVDADGKGTIAGANPRSVLLAVYRYLTELGCRWVRPGSDGEWIPRLNSLKAVKVAETPSYRHRAVCIEGAVSEEHVSNMIAWIPKLGFNGYFIQFREAWDFWNRWYNHALNPKLQGEPVTLEEARQYTRNVEAEIKRRDLLYHAVGHGWTCEALGIEGLGWDVDQTVPEEAKKLFAQVDGKREVWGGTPINTNLCYGNPEARRLVAEEIANYSEKHPEIDYMHFWLADGSNNNCECDLCKDTRPSDFYVMMLNELDKLLTARGISTRIVFLIYVDLLWPPVKERIKNPDRFVLMFAPITRSYSRPFSAAGELPPVPEYTRNKLTFPRNVDENLAFLRAWQEIFHGDSFDFDYHLMWDHYKDPGHLQISQGIARDMKALKEIDLNGLVSCQIQRLFLPTGMHMTAMGRTLWNTGTDYAALEAEYFWSAYGSDGPRARIYLEQISKLFDPVYVRGEKPKVDDDSISRLRLVSELTAQMQPTIDINMRHENQCWAKSWFYLKHHARICDLLAAALLARALEDDEAVARNWQGLRDYVCDNEMQLHPALDVYEFTRTLGRLFGKER